MPSCPVTRNTLHQTWFGAYLNCVKIVANFSVGVDHCNLKAFRDRSIIVTNTPEVLSDATAKIAILLMLGAARRAGEGERMMRDGSWTDWSPAFMVGSAITGKRLGNIGMGRVGQTGAAKAIKDIRRATRKQYSAEEKIRIVLDGLRGEETIAELCRIEGIAQSIYYKWSKEFMEAGKRRLSGDTARLASTGEVIDLRREAPGEAPHGAWFYWKRRIQYARIILWHAFDYLATYGRPERAATRGPGDRPTRR